MLVLLIRAKILPTTYDQQRPPPLVRLDSKSNLSPRLGFPNQQGGQFRPPQPRPQFPGSPQFGARAPLQRNPSSGQFNLAQNQNVRQVNPTAGLRPVTPFPRQGATSPRSPTNTYQQKPFPVPAQPNKGQTLDTAPDFIQKDAAEYPVQTSNIIEEEEPISLTKKEEDLENDNKYISNNIDDSKTDKYEDLPPRPESRNQKVYEEEYPEKKSPIQPTERKSPVQSVEINEEPKVFKTESLNVHSDEKVVEKENAINDEKIERKSRSPEPPRTPRTHKMTLNFDEQTKPKSPKIQSGKIEDKTPSPAKKTTLEKPKTLKPDTKIRNSRNRLLKSPSKSEGDTDSGVDETTQGNDQSANGEQHSPRKSPGKNTARTTASPTKSRSLSRGSKSPNLKTPDSPTPSIPSGNDKKKVPMNKVHVGAVPSPNLKEVRSKIGSLQNASYKPGGGNVKIEHKKIDISKAQSKIAAKNDTYIPGGGEKKIEHRKLQWNVSSKIGSLENTGHKPKGGEKKIETIKLDFKEKAKPKVGSKDNIKHQPGGGDVKTEAELDVVKLPANKPDIETKKLDIKAKSKIGSLDNVKHKPGGGDRKIFDDKDYLRQKSGLSGENNSLNGSQPITPVMESYSPEVNLISPTQERVRLLDTTSTEFAKPDNRPPSRLTRTSSLRSSKKCTPRSPWRM